MGRKDPDGKKYFYYPDHLGSTDIVTDENGNIVEDIDYMPFGEVLQNTENRFLFTGKEKDKETELMYYEARYYSPFLKRFTQADTLISDVYDPQSLNRYSYARNNPVNRVDPSGHLFWIPFAIGAMYAINFAITYFLIPSIENIEVTLLDYMNARNSCSDGSCSTAGEFIKNRIGNIAFGKVVGKAMDKAFNAGKKMFGSKSGKINTGSIFGKGGSFKETSFSKIGKQESVNPKELFTYQKQLIPGKAGSISKSLDNGIKTPPVDVIQINNRNIIVNGNHRWQGHLISGRDRIDAKYVSYDDIQKRPDLEYLWGKSLEDIYKGSHTGEKYNYDLGWG